MDSLVDSTGCILDASLAKVKPVFDSVARQSYAKGNEEDACRAFKPAHEASMGLGLGGDHVGEGA